MKSRCLPICWWTTAIAFGACFSWISRFSINPDGVSYLDIGDAWWRGDLHTALNPYWSPMYSWIVGGFLRVFHPSIYWEYPAVHLANFLIYCFALFCFELLLREMRLEGWTRSIAYALFIFSSVAMIGLGSVTPDMLVAGFVYLIAALGLKARESLDLRQAIIYGVVLGGGYLAKTILLPVGVVFIVMVYLVTRRRALIWSAAIFVLISTPWIAVCSSLKHRPTIGESARFAYLVHVNNISPFYPSESPHTKVLSTNPRIFDLSMIGGTFPAWIDPSYWQDGIKPTLTLAGIAQQLKISAFMSLVLFIDPRMQLNLVLALIAALVCGFRFHPDRALLMLLAIPSLAAFAAYFPLQVEARYVAPFLVIAWLLLFSGLGIKPWLAGFVVFSSLAVTLWNINTVRKFDKKSAFAVSAALELNKLPHHDIAVISPEDWMKTAGQASFIARLTRSHIVAESLDTRDPSAVADALAGKADGVLLYLPGEPPSGWSRLAATDYYYRDLAQQ